MKEIVVYTMRYCPYCESAKKLLQAKGYPFKEILVEMDDDAMWNRLEKETGFKTMPQIFIGESFVGGFRELSQLNSKGTLDKMVQG